MKRRAVFLDRDGTLNLDKGYIKDPDNVELFPGVAEGLKLLKENKFLLIVVSNQSGVGRGYFGQKQVEGVNDRLNQMLAKEGVQIDRFYTCPHNPEEGCCCRKPSAEMVLAGAKFFNVELSKSFFVGDKTSDVQTGLAAGCKTVWIDTGEYPLDKGIVPDVVVKNFLQAAQWIIKK